MSRDEAYRWRNLRDLGRVGPIDERQAGDGERPPSRPYVHATCPGGSH